VGTMGERYGVEVKVCKGRGWEVRKVGSYVAPVLTGGRRREWVERERKERVIRCRKSALSQYTNDIHDPNTES
jgi:hypothetical protein